LKRLPLALLVLASAIACGENGPATAPRVLVKPLLDSLFVADTVSARSATYLDARGDTQPAGPVRWSSSDSNIVKVDSITGVVVARASGAAVVSARANGVTGNALVVVTRALELTLLLDTIYLMPGDTFTVPVEVRDTGSTPPPVWFNTSANGVFLIDSATGRINAIGFGGPLTFTAHADTVARTGAVEVVQLVDTVGGKGFFSVLGTVIRRDRAGARAVNYKRQGDTVTFRVSLPVLSGNIAVENMLITLRDSVHDGGQFFVDSISPNEAFSSDPVCRPPRAWGLWSIQTNPPLRALSRRGGSLAITQLVTIAHGRAISGRFSITGQRTDFYDDPDGALPIRGTFVAPLITDPSRPCR
jgi:hypothetical protein